MATDLIGPINALKNGCAILKRYPVPLLGGFTIFVSILVACAEMPITYLNWALLAIVALPLVGGLHILFLKAARDADPKLTDLFSGFREFWKWSAAGWTFLCLFIVCLVPCMLLLFAVAWLVAFSAPSSPVLSHDTYCLQLKMRALMFAPVPAFILFTEYALMLFATADATGVNQSVSRSQELVRGRRFQLCITMLTSLMLPGTLLVIGYIVSLTNANAFGWPGWTAYTLGVAVATVIALCSVTWTSVRLDQLVLQDQACHRVAIISCQDLDEHPLSDL